MYIKCTDCDLKTLTKDFVNDIKIPKEGVLESSIEYNYCENCKDLTKWFLGKGIPNLTSRERVIEIERLKEKEEFLEKKTEEVKKLEKITSNFLYNLIYGSKLKGLKDDLYYLEKDVRNSKLELEDSDSIKFYNNLKPKPKCLECGCEKLHQRPRHKCGGYLFFENENKGLYKATGPLPLFNINKYDEYGNVGKTEYSYDRPIHGKHTPLSEEMRRLLVSIP